MADDPPSSPSTLDKVWKERDLDNATPKDEVPNFWCGSLRKQQRPAYNPYRDALGRNFFLVRLDDSVIYLIWMGRVFATAMRDARSIYSGWYQMRYGRPTKRDRKLTMSRDLEVVGM